MSTSRLRRTTSPIEPLLRPIHAFLSAESAGGVLLLVATLVALAWANSRWSQGYIGFWHTELSVSAGPLRVALSLERCVNDGLMVLFFLLAGLEIKRELVFGELASLRKAALPVIAAVGGMVVPACIYAIVNRGGGPAAAGWGIPMATDIAFAVGVLTVVGRALPISMKVFLLAVAIVDDLGAVLVIALFYTHDIAWLWLGIAAAFLAALLALNVVRIHRPLPYIVLGVGLWAATLASGVHATVAGVLLAFTIPATRRAEEAPFVNFARARLDAFAGEVAAVPDKLTEHQSHALHELVEATQDVQPPLAVVEHALLRPVNFAIVPLFALANAGVDLQAAGVAAFRSPVTCGVIAGLVLGKPIGVLLASWIAIRASLAAMPDGATLRQFAGVACLCGIGFTMSLFVSGLAFSGQADEHADAKLGIMAASVIAAALGGITLAFGRRPGSGSIP